VLDLAPGATAEEVRKAYVDLAHVWHPDRFQSNPVLRAEAGRKMQEIDEAYKTLVGFLPVLRKSDELDVVVPVEPKEVEDVLDSTDRGSTLKYSIAAFLVLVIAGLLIIALALIAQRRAVPVQY
jgi:hypothetical protein